MPDYTQWPTAADVQKRIESLGIAVRVDIIDRATEVLSAVTAEVERRTRRQFLTVTETRTFDGSGSPTLDVDEIVSVSTVTIQGGWGAPAYDLTNVDVFHESGRPCSRIVVGKGSLPAFATAGILSPFRLFPEGRQNILVTASWGYGATIPTDLWHGVCGEAAIRITREAIWQANRLSSETYGDEKRTYDIDDGTRLAWHEQFEQLMQVEPKGYQRSGARKTRRLRGPML